MYKILCIRTTVCGHHCKNKLVQNTRDYGTIAQKYEIVEL